MVKAMLFYNYMADGMKSFGLIYFHPLHVVWYHLRSLLENLNKKLAISICLVEKLYAVSSWYSNEEYDMKLNVNDVKHQLSRSKPFFYDNNVDWKKFNATICNSVLENRSCLSKIFPNSRTNIYKFGSVRMFCSIMRSFLKVRYWSGK